MTKKEILINIIYEQTNVKLENDKDNVLNKKRNWLYTKIEPKNKYDVFTFLERHKINVNKHINNYYWIEV